VDALKNLVRVVFLVFALLLLFLTAVSAVGRDGVRTYYSSGIVIDALAVAAIVIIGWTWWRGRERNRGR